MQNLLLFYRVIDKVYLDPTRKCWLWTGNTNPTTGYGSLSVEGKSIGAHRAMWIAKNGPIPAGMVVMHECDVRCCVNPRHLRLGTQSENIRDMVGRGRGRWGHASAVLLGRTNLLASP